MHSACPELPVHWPPGLPRHLEIPDRNLFQNLEASAFSQPEKPFIVYYDTQISYAEVKEEAERVAGFLQHEAAIQAGDRVLLYLQNSPQWIIAFYGILRANSVVVPVNPMNMTEELRHYVRDSGALVAIVGQELVGQVAPLLNAVGTGSLNRLLVATYCDYLRQPTDLDVPDFVASPRQQFDDPKITHWTAVQREVLPPRELVADGSALCVLPYTSGTTGQPKGCMHTHRSLSSSLECSMRWFSLGNDAVFLATLPFFHVIGLTGAVAGPAAVGATIVVLSRWDREVALRCIERYEITVWQSISTMMVDFLSHTSLDQYDLTSLRVLRGGGAAMPETVARKLQEVTGLAYVEGYGMSETMAATHINPPQRPKRQCLGIPAFDVDARVVDPGTLKVLPSQEVGEIVISAPQVMLGYWNNIDATEQVFIEIDGKRFLRTGDLAKVDDDGYFVMVDRIKRMINAAGFKVWPAEVEAIMYGHPSIKEVCVIAAKDARRGETVKALVVLKDGDENGELSATEIMAWARERMAAYKSPRVVEIVASLPKSGTGKILWRELQDRET
ncbi:long-chain-fatty-acid--CoA ligase (plasmid) [Cupriavidus basilensis]